MILVSMDSFPSLVSKNIEIMPQKQKPPQNATFLGPIAGQSYSYFTPLHAIKSTICIVEGKRNYLDPIGRTFLEN